MTWIRGYRGDPERSCAARWDRGKNRESYQGEPSYREVGQRPNGSIAGDKRVLSSACRSQRSRVSDATRSESALACRMSSSSSSILMRSASARVCLWARGERPPAGCSLPIGLIRSPPPPVSGVPAPPSVWSWTEARHPERESATDGRTRLRLFGSGPGRRLRSQRRDRGVERGTSDHRPRTGYRLGGGSP